jgi:hypothetical protein
MQIPKFITCFSGREGNLINEIFFLLNYVIQFI